jgi:hypothetical protein
MVMSGAQSRHKRRDFVASLSVAGAVVAVHAEIRAAASDVGSDRGREPVAICVFPSEVFSDFVNPIHLPTLSLVPPVDWATVERRYFDAIETWWKEFGVGGSKAGLRPSFAEYIAEVRDVLMEIGFDAKAVGDGLDECLERIRTYRRQIADQVDYVVLPFDANELVPQLPLRVNALVWNSGLVGLRADSRR